MASFIRRKSTFGAYTEIETIGKGTFGTVFLVKKSNDHDPDDTVSQHFALKKIPFPAKNRQREEELIKREEEILRKVNHRHVIRYYESFKDKDSVYLVMEYCDGGNLHEFIRNLQHKMHEDMFLNFIDQITQGIKYLHKNNIMHRDIKTKNILLTKWNILKICDFGVAKLTETAGPAPYSTWMGTPRYMSPEIVRKEPYSFKTDIWSLGCTAYEMAFTKYAFTADTFSKIFNDISSGHVPNFADIQFCEDIKDIMKRMLHISQNKRPSAKEILKLLTDHDCAGHTGNKDHIPIVNSVSSSPSSTLSSRTGSMTAGDTRDSGLGVSSKVKKSCSKAKEYLEKASTEFQSMLVEIIHDRNGVDIVKELKEAQTVEAAEQILKRYDRKKIKKKFSDIMQVVESLLNVEGEIRRLDDLDVTLSTQASSTLSYTSS